MNELYEIDAVTGVSVGDALWANEYHWFSPDIFLSVARLAFDTTGVISHASATTDRNTWRTVVKRKPTLLDSLSLFYEVLTAGEIARSEPSGNWRPRERLSASGIVFPDAVVTNKILSDLQSVDDVDQGLIPLDIYVYGTNDWFISVDLFFEFVERFLKGESQATFKTVLTGSFMNNAGAVSNGPGARIEVEYTVNRFANDDFRYTVVLDAIGYDSSYIKIGYQETYGVTIHRDKQHPWCLALEQSDVHAWYMQSDPGAGSFNYRRIFQYADRPAIFARQESLYTVADGRETFRRLQTLSPIAVSHSFPALYHTQSKATVDMLGKVSENFESLMESPGFLPVIWEVAKVPGGLGKAILKTTTKLKGVVKTIPFIERVRVILRLICGSYLAYVFAIQPTLKSAKDIYERFLDETDRTKGEASLIFEGDASSYGSLPDGLRRQLLAMEATDVARYKIAFRSECQLSLNRPRAHGVISSLISDAARLGLEPDPTQLWLSLPFSFVFDAAIIPMGRLISDAYTRYKLIGMRGTTFGHSVSISITYTTGLRVHVYLRSEPTVLAIDPPRDSWLQSRGLPVNVAIPLGILQLI